MTVMLADAKIIAPHLDLDMAGGAYQVGDRAYPDLASIAGVALTGAGGIALTPGGGLKSFAADTPRIVPGYGLLLEPASSNLLTLDNAAPVSTAGWPLLNSRPAGATITLVDDTAALTAAQDPASGEHIFADLLAARILNGKVIRLYNPAASGATFFAIFATVQANTATAISAYLRCLSGSAQLAVLGGGGYSDAYSSASWARVGSAHTAVATNQNAVVALPPGSEIYVILPQVEMGALVTSPIVTAGAPRVRAADKMVITAPEWLGRPHTIYLDLTMSRLDFAARTFLTVSDGFGNAVTLDRANDNTLSSTNPASIYRPRICRCYGPGNIRAGLRNRARGRTLGYGGALAHDPFYPSPGKLTRLELGNSLDGSAPINGWIRRVFAECEHDDDLMTANVLPQAGAAPIDIFRYIDPAGSDSNDGLTPATPWKTLAKGSDDTLPNGAHVLLKAGGVWAGELALKSYVTYRPYGDGARPQFGAGGLYGVDNNSAVAPRIEGMSIQGATQRGYNQFGNGGTQLSDNEIAYCGTLTDNNSIGVGYRSAKDFYFARNHLHNIVGVSAGDDVFLQDVQGVVICEGNKHETPNGAAADCFQIANSTAADVANPVHAIVRGNYLDMKTLPTNSGKGGMVLACNSAEIEDNYIFGLNFCIGLDGPNMTVRRNICHGARYQPYSWGIGDGGATDVANHVYEDNFVYDCNRAFALSGTGGSPTTGPNRIDFIVRYNGASGCTTGLFVDRPVSGIMEFNTMSGCTTPIDIRTTVVPAGGSAANFRKNYNKVLA